jgi:hypothetical protein
MARICPVSRPALAISRSSATRASSRIAFLFRFGIECGEDLFGRAAKAFHTKRSCASSG